MSGGETKHNRTVEGLRQRFSQLERLIPVNTQSNVLTLVSNSIKNSVDKLSFDFDFAKSNYLEELLEEMLQSISESNTTLEKRIEECLWQFNFNARPLFLYFINRISNEVQKEETLVGKLELLAFELKKVNQMVCDSNVRFTDKYPCLQDVVNNWISEEIIFLRTKQELTIKSAHPEKAISNDFKISLNLSVAQFSCLVRGLIEKKLILNTNLTELASFLSGVVVTKRSENISEGSFRRKYYDIEDSTKKSVVEILNKTIDWIMKS